MSKNLADLTPNQRATLADEREQALLRHQAAKALQVHIQNEYDRIMNERIRNPKGWGERWANLVDDIDDTALREAVRSKVYGFIQSIGGRGLPKSNKR